jgi:hypothetical protein
VINYTSHNICYLSWLIHYQQATCLYVGNTFTTEICVHVHTSHICALIGRHSHSRNRSDKTHSLARALWSYMDLPKYVLPLVATPCPHRTEHATALAWRRGLIYVTVYLITTTALIRPEIGRYVNKKHIVSAWFPYIERSSWRDPGRDVVAWWRSQRWPNMTKKRQPGVT